MDWLWLIGGLGALGVGGYVAALFLAPALAAVVGDVFVKFVNSRVGLAVVVGLAAAFGAGLYVRHNMVAYCNQRVAKVNSDWADKFDQAAENFKQARLNRDAEVDRKLREANARRQQELDSSEQAWKEKFKEYKASLAADPACVITKKDLEK